jgi:hypothetical protein
VTFRVGAAIRAARAFPSALGGSTRGVVLAAREDLMIVRETVRVLELK